MDPILPRPTQTAPVGSLGLSGGLPRGFLDSFFQRRSIHFEIERPSRSASFSIASRSSGLSQTLTLAVRVDFLAIAPRCLIRVGLPHSA